MTRQSEDVKCIYASQCGCFSVYLELSSCTLQCQEEDKKYNPIFLWATKFTTVIKKMSLLSIFPVHCALSHVHYILSQDEMYSRRGYMDEAFVMSLQFLMKSGSFPKPKFVFPMLVMFVCKHLYFPHIPYLQTWLEQSSAMPHSPFFFHWRKNAPVIWAMRHGCLLPFCTKLGGLSSTFSSEDEKEINKLYLSKNHHFCVLMIGKFSCGP